MNWSRLSFLSVFFGSCLAALFSSKSMSLSVDCWIPESSDRSSHPNDYVTRAMVAASLEA